MGYGQFTQDVLKLPIRQIDSQNPDDKILSSRVVTLVDSMLVLQNQLTSTKSSAKRDIIQRQINATDAEIDQLVYDLYRLTEKEIAIVEGNNP